MCLIRVSFSTWWVPLERSWDWLSSTAGCVRPCDISPNGLLSTKNGLWWVHQTWGLRWGKQISPTPRNRFQRLQLENRSRSQWYFNIRRQTCLSLRLGFWVVFNEKQLPLYVVFLTFPEKLCLFEFVDYAFNDFEDCYFCLPLVFTVWPVSRYSKVPITKRALSHVLKSKFPRIEKQVLAP